MSLCGEECSYVSIYCSMLLYFIKVLLELSKLMYVFVGRANDKNILTLKEELW